MLGSERWRGGAERVVATGSFWANAVPFAAALATIPLAAEAARSAEACGMLLRRGLAEQAAAAGLGEDFAQTGPPQMPFFDFRSERRAPLSERRRILAFCGAAAARGVIFHPFHTMFIGGAHTEAHVEATLRATQRAFEAVVAAGKGENGGGGDDGDGERRGAGKAKL